MDALTQRVAGELGMSSEMPAEEAEAPEEEMPAEEMPAEEMSAEENQPVYF